MIPILQRTEGQREAVICPKTQKDTDCVCLTPYSEVFPSSHPLSHSAIADQSADLFQALSLT